ncbi:hypothetical protein DNTS_004918, partial [Danionella cerebrum]
GALYEEEEEEEEEEEGCSNTAVLVQSHALPAVTQSREHRGHPHAATELKLEPVSEEFSGATMKNQRLLHALVLILASGVHYSRSMERNKDIPAGLGEFTQMAQESFQSNPLRKKLHWYSSGVQPFTLSCQTQSTSVNPDDA